MKALPVPVGFAPFRAYRIMREFRIKTGADGEKLQELIVWMKPLPDAILAPDANAALEMAKLDDPFPTRLCVEPITESRDAAHLPKPV